MFTYEDLGPYKYVLCAEDGVRDRYQQALDRLAAYDRRRGTQLLQTLEGYLDGRGNVVGSSRALYIHPNTLRQRLAGSNASPASTWSTRTGCRWRSR